MFEAFESNLEDGCYLLRQLIFVHRFRSFVDSIIKWWYIWMIWKFSYSGTYLKYEKIYDISLIYVMTCHYSSSLIKLKMICCIVIIVQVWSYRYFNSYLDISLGDFYGIERILMVIMSWYYIDYLYMLSILNFNTVICNFYYINSFIYL
jgi:hypothetical protein